MGGGLGGDGYSLGESYFSSNDYIEYVPGNLPIIISAPHGGDIEPEGWTIADGLASDGGSRATAVLVRDQIEALTGRRPHLIINHLKRSHLNLNREDAYPNVGLPAAEDAWAQFHTWIEDASDWVEAACGRGHYFDFHTNGHSEGWLEVGQGLAGSELDLPDDELDQQQFRDDVTFRALINTPDIDFIDVLRGSSSIGGLMESSGYATVPSPAHPGPEGGGYFNGGHNTHRHGSKSGGTIDGTQFEMSYTEVNQGASKREAFAEALAGAMIVYMETNYGFDLSLSQ